MEIVPAEEIAEANRDACPEERVTTEHDLVRVFSVSHCHLVDLSLQDNCHDDTIDGHCLTEDYAKLLLSYLTRFLERIRGAFTAEPRILAPAMKMPLY